MKLKEALELLEVEEECAYNEYKGRCDKHCETCKFYLCSEIRLDICETIVATLK